MKINLTKFYDIGKIEHWTTSTGVSMYDMELISKSTGEVITWSFAEEFFDEWLDEMEKECIGLKAHYDYISWARKRKEEHEPHFY